jgi:predicted nicotinamide N-methyase
VTATDGASDAVAFAAHNLAINDVVGSVAQVDWRRQAQTLIDGGPWDLVIAADVLYVRYNVEALLRVLPRLGDEAIVVDPSRAGGRDFLAAARRLFTIDTQRDPARDRVVVHRLRRGRARGR